MDTNIDLFQLYEECNVEYFSGELLPIDDVFWSPRFRLALGRASLTYIEGKPRIAIGISSKINQNPEKTRSVMVHEQIHVLQYQKFLQTGSDLFLDEVSEHSTHSKGHGNFFHKIADLLNSTHPELNIMASDDEYISTSIEKGSFHYVVVKFLRDEGVRTTVFFTGRSIGQNGIQHIEQDFFELYGRQSLLSIELFKTKNPIVTNYSRLTSKFGLRANQVPVHYSNESISLLSTIESTLLQSKEYPQLDCDISKSLSSSLVKHRKMRYMSFSDYMMSVVASTESLRGNLGKNDIETFIGLDDGVVTTIFSEWKHVRPSEISRSTLFYETVGSEKLDDIFRDKALNTLVDFGVSRIKVSEYLTLLKDSLVDRYPITILDDEFNILRDYLNAGVRNRTLESKSRYIGMDRESYVYGCALSSLNDGQRVSDRDIKEISDNWSRPTIQNVGASLSIRDNLDFVVSDILPLYLSKSMIQAGRKFDSMVSGWGSYISRGISPAQISDIIQSRIENISLNNKNYGRESAALSSAFKSYLKGMLDSSISHCYGSGEMRKRKPGSRPDVQMDIFG